MEKNKSVYLAIDSDILRKLTFIDLVLNSGEFYNFEQSEDPILKKWSGYFLRLYYRMKSDEIRLVIVDGVFQESQHSESLVAFMKNYCYFPKINAVNYHKKAIEARNLAYAYCQEYTVDDKTFPPPMKFHYNPEINAYSPTTDCYIMAQASIEGIGLVTANGKDFIFNERSKNENNARTIGIMTINEKMGYSSKNLDSKYKNPRPYHIRTIGPMISKNTNQEFEVTEAFNDFDKGTEIL